MHTANDAWLSGLRTILEQGYEVCPRGLRTLEVPHNTLRFSALTPVVSVPDRKLNYSFMAAEALWILSGDDTVDGIAPWNKHIAQFSDNGRTFFGAYGPPVVAQLDYVVSTLVKDPDTRQAVLTIWRQNPAPTKDVPCTVAIGFSVRENAINAHVFMRSNDAWLGTPYDMFNFSMILAKVACRYNNEKPTGRPTVILGDVFLTAVSYHLYEPQYQAAQAILESNVVEAVMSGGTVVMPVSAVLDGDWGIIHRGLLRCRDKEPANGNWTARPKFSERALNHE